MNAPLPQPMALSSALSTASRLLARLSPFAIIASIVGADLEVLRKCGHASWSSVFWTFALVLLSFIWQTILFASAAAVMLGGGEFQLTHLALAVLLSAILTLVEVQVFIGPSWHQHGLASLAQTGRFTPPPNKG